MTKPDQVLTRHFTRNNIYDRGRCQECREPFPCLPAQLARQLQEAQERVAAWTVADKAYVNASLHRMSQHTKAAMRAEEAASEVKFAAEVALHELIDPSYSLAEPRP